MQVTATTAEAVITMLKKNSKSLGHAADLTTLAALAFALFAVVHARAQQTSPSVPANIDTAATGSSKGATIPNQTMVTAAPEGLERLKLAPGYLLQMDIYNTPEMTTPLRIDEQGDVTVPLVGSVHIGGETLSQAQSTIAKALVDKEILKAPQVTLNLVQFAAKNISVLGEVHSPGRIQMLAPESLGDVLALVGGETIAAGNDIEIQHHAETGGIAVRHVKYVQGKNTAALQSVLVDPGDTVLVHRAGIVYVLGAVYKPGGYLMVNGGSIDLIQAISLAGGTTLQASTRWAVIVRKQGTGLVQFKVPLDKIEKGGASPVQLQWDDAVYVPTSTWKSVLINGSAIMGAAASAVVFRVP